MWEGIQIWLRHRNRLISCYFPGVTSQGSSHIVRHGNVLLSMVLLALVIGRSGDVMAQSRTSLASEEAINRLRAAVMSADAAGITSESAATMEIVLMGEGRYYSRGQATLLLRDFLEEYPPQSFSVDRFTRTPTAGFVEASYSVQDSDVRLEWMIRYRIQGGQWRIRELVIEEVDA